MDEREKKILKTFENMNRLGRKEISADTISLTTGLPRQLVHKKLNSMEKYGFVRKKKKKPVFYWESM